MAMTSRERVLTALHRKEPDRIPYCELGIDRALAQTFSSEPRPGQRPVGPKPSNA